MVTDGGTGPLFGCVEAGGTKFMLGVARGPHALLRTARVPTTTPSETLAAALDFFEAARRAFGDIAAFGIASFGPVDLDPCSPSWGSITNTPKPGWRDTDLAGVFARRFGCPVGFDTDVNGAILAERQWGAAAGADVAVYVTVGTGIGGGAVVGDRPIHGSRHPEMGHMLPRRHPDDHEFPAFARFTATVWRDWRAARRSIRVGVHPCPSSRPMTRRTTSSPIIWRNW